ncbi:hypothetical protein [Jiangella mangrovi]|uniref:FDXHR family putative zinc-binding protein n=1 Tax=Jiangella mangrovi TaxID=1524084 RepID=UPI003CCCE733
MRITHPACGCSWSGLRAEHCPACCQTFSGTSAGDAHRRGEHGVTEGPDRRRCLSPGEVRVNGYPLREVGGVWRIDRPYDGPRDAAERQTLESPAAERTDPVPLAA